MVNKGEASANVLVVIKLIYRVLNNNYTFIVSMCRSRAVGATLLQKIAVK